MPPLFGSTTSGQSQAAPAFGVSRSYGDVRAQLAEEFPATSLDRIDQLIAGRIHTIVERMRWHQLQQNIIFQTVAPFETGTAIFTQGAAIVTSTNALWTAAQNGLLIRAAGDTALYTFTFQSPFAGQLDRPYNGLASGQVGYQILCSTYGLPSIAGQVERVRNLSVDATLNDATRDDFDNVDPSRTAVGTPTDWAPIEPFGNNGEPLNIQVELFPIPDAIYDMSASVVLDWAGFGPQDTGNYFPRFFDCNCLLAGIRADLDKPNMEIQEKLFEARLAMMQLSDMRRKGPQRPTMHAMYTRHRQSRWDRNNRYYSDNDPQ